MAPALPYERLSPSLSHPILVIPRVAGQPPPVHPAPKFLYRCTSLVLPSLLMRCRIGLLMILAGLPLGGTSVPPPV